MITIIIWSLCEELLSDPELLSSFVLFYLMDLHVFTFPTQPWSDFSISHIPLRKPCRCFVQSLFFSSYFLLFIHQIVSAFPDWCWTQLVVSFFTQMFTRLKLTDNSLGSSVSTLLLAKLLGHWTWDCSPVWAVFYSSVVFFLIYKMWEIVVVIYRNVIQVARVNGSRCCLAVGVTAPVHRRWIRLSSMQLSLPGELDQPPSGCFSSHPPPNGTFSHIFHIIGLKTRWLECSAFYFGSLYISGFCLNKGWKNLLLSGSVGSFLWISR